MKYHGNNDPNDPAVRAEAQEIRETLALEKELALSFREILVTRNLIALTSDFVSGESETITHCSVCWTFQ